MGETRVTTSSAARHGTASVRPRERAEPPLIALLLCSLGAVVAFAVPMVVAWWAPGAPAPVVEVRQRGARQSLGRARALPPPLGTALVPRLALFSFDERGVGICVDPRAWRQSVQVAQASGPSDSH